MGTTDKFIFAIFPHFSIFNEFFSTLVNAMKNFRKKEFHKQSSSRYNERRGGLEEFSI